MNKHASLAWCGLAPIIFGVAPEAQTTNTFPASGNVGIGTSSRLSKYLVSYLLVLMLFCVPSVIYAQQTAIDETGFKPYGAYHAGEIDAIDMVNLKPQIVIPLLDYPQRGSLHFSFNIVYHSPMFIPDVQCPPDNPAPARCTAFFSGAIPTITIEPSFSFRLDHECDSLNVCLLTEGEGVAKHQMRPLGPQYYTQEWLSSDGTGIRQSSNIITDADGVRHQDLGSAYGLSGSQPTIAVDPNGNAITATFDSQLSGAIIGWTDSIGRYVPYFGSLFNGPPIPSAVTAGLTQDFSGCTGQLPTAEAYLWDVPGIGTSTGTARYKICLANISVTANMPNCDPSNCSVSTDPRLTIQSIVLPNGQTWTFNYDIAGGYADLSSIIFPTGGSISYTWMNYTFCGTGTYKWVQVSRALQTRTLNAQDGSGDHLWKYVQNITGLPNNVTTTVTDPNNDVAIHTLTPLGGYCSLYETQLDQYKGSSTLLQSTSTSYNYTQDPQYLPDAFYTPIYNVVPSSTSITYPSGQQNLVLTTYDKGIPSWNGSSLLYGKMIFKQEYDFGNGSFGPLLRQTAYSYKWQSDSNYQAVNLLDTPCLVTVYGIGTVPQQTSCTPPAVQSNQVAQTVFGYDENNGSPQGVYGKQTSQTNWLSSGSSPRSQIVYNSQGMPSKKCDPIDPSCANPTIYTYDGTGAFAKQVQYPTTNGVQHIDQFVYDANTGKVTSHTDQNSQATLYGYDSMRRLTSVTYPDGGSEGYTYNDSAPNPSLTYKRAIDSGRTYVAVNVADGFGRTIQTQISDPAGSIYTDTTYDNKGRLHSRSNPYRSARDTTYGVTTYNYDALDRISSQVDSDGSSTQYWCYNGAASAGQLNCYSHIGSKSGTWIDFQDETGNQWQRTSDALGRLVEVAEPNGASAIASMETDYTYDALNNLLSVTQYSSRSRSFNYDGLSRLLCASNPENSSAACPAANTGAYVAGTIGYGYDANGNVTSKTDVRGVVTSYTYDALNRLYSKTYSSAPAGTVSSCYQYDTATKGMGKLGAEWTQAGSCASSPPANYQSLRVFGVYDAMGRVVAEQQCAAGYCTSASIPSSPQANCLTLSSASGLQYCYDLAGNLLAFSNGVTTQAAGSYPQHGLLLSQTFDTVGRLATVSGSWSDPTHPTSLLSNSSYAPNNALSNWQLGANLFTARQYDNRLRICSQQSGQQQVTAPLCAQ